MVKIVIMLDEPAELIVEVLNSLDVDVFTFWALMCVVFLVLLKEDIKNWRQTNTTDKASIVLLLFLIFFFGVLSIISP